MGKLFGIIAMLGVVYFGGDFTDSSDADSNEENTTTIESQGAAADSENQSAVSKILKHLESVKRMRASSTNAANSTNNDNLINNSSVDEGVNPQEETTLTIPSDEADSSSLTPDLKHEGLQDLYGSFMQTNVSPKAVKEAFAFFIKYQDQFKLGKAIAIADLTKNQKNKRLYIGDLRTGEVSKEYVTHGRGTNNQCDPDQDGMVNFWSNEDGSNCSPYGFMRVGKEIYNPHRDAYSYHLELNGFGKSIDERTFNVSKRLIQIHYSNEFTEGSLWRTQGCPACTRQCYVRLVTKLEKEDDGTQALFYNYMEGIPRLSDEKKLHEPDLQNVSSVVNESPDTNIDATEAQGISNDQTVSQSNNSQCDLLDKATVKVSHWKNSKKVEDYMNKYSLTAQRIFQQTGLPASFLLGFTGFESAYETSSHAKKDNNLTGSSIDSGDGFSSNYVYLNKEIWGRSIKLKRSKGSQQDSKRSTIRFENPTDSLYFAADLLLTSGYYNGKPLKKEMDDTKSSCNHLDSGQGIGVKKITDKIKKLDLSTDTGQIELKEYVHDLTRIMDFMWAPNPCQVPDKWKVEANIDYDKTVRSIINTSKLDTLDHNIKLCK